MNKKQKRINKKERIINRRKMLEAFIKALESGHINEENFDEQIKDFSRREYVSPLDRNSYNYGYMETHEFGVNNQNEW